MAPSFSTHAELDSNLWAARFARAHAFASRYSEKSGASLGGGLVTRLIVAVRLLIPPTKLNKAQLEATISTYTSTHVALADLVENENENTSDALKLINVMKDLRAEGEADGMWYAWYTKQRTRLQNIHLDVDDESDDESDNTAMLHRVGR